MMQLTETTETLLQLLVDCDAVQAGGNPNEQGLCDAIDNDGCHYQSSALAGWLEVARKAGIRPMLRLEKVPNVQVEGAAGGLPPEAPARTQGSASPSCKD